jgi:hypothetical protein
VFVLRSCLDGDVPEGPGWVRGWCRIQGAGAGARACCWAAKRWAIP